MVRHPRWWLFDLILLFRLILNTFLVGSGLLLVLLLRMNYLNHLLFDVLLSVALIYVNLLIFVD